jgi:hypothetical protein
MADPIVRIPLKGFQGNGPSGMSQIKRGGTEAPNGDIHTLSQASGDIIEQIKCSNK